MKKIILTLMITMTLKVFGAGHILMYHRFGDDRYPSTSVSVESFTGQLDYLEEEGYEIVELSTIMEGIEKGKSIPKKWIAITIDDAYRSFYENSLPILKEGNYPFTLFVNTEAVDKGYGDFMTWAMVEDAGKYGEIGGHSHTHPSLPKVGLEKAREEIEISKRVLEEKLGTKMRYFAYPYGEYSDEVKEIVESSGYDGAFKQVMGAVDASSDLYALNRIPVGEDTNLDFYLSMGYLPMKWKNIDVKENVLIGANIEVPEEVNKVEVFLSGYGWEWTPVVDGEILVNKELKRSRNNLIIRDEKKRYNDYLLLK